MKLLWGLAPGDAFPSVALRCGSITERTERTDFEDERSRTTGKCFTESRLLSRSFTNISKHVIRSLLRKDMNSFLIV